MCSFICRDEEARVKNAIRTSRKKSRSITHADSGPELPHNLPTHRILHIYIHSKARVQLLGTLPIGSYLRVKRTERKNFQTPRGCCTVQTVHGWGRWLVLVLLRLGQEFSVDRRDLRYEGGVANRKNTVVSLYRIRTEVSGDSDRVFP